MFCTSFPRCNLCRYVAAEWRIKMRKRLISFLLTLCMTVPLALPVSAQTTKREDWNGNKDTPNLIPVMNEGDTLTAVGWKNVGDEINRVAYKINDRNYTNKVGIQAYDDSDDIGTKQYTGGVYWQIDFSDEDKVKINKGDILLSSSARYWIQNSAHHYLSLRYEFFNAQNTLLDDTKKITYENYWAVQKDIFLELNDVKIPANTAYVKIWFSNWGSLAGRPFIGDISAHLTDTAAPKLINAPYEYSVNGSTSAPSYTVPGDKVTYALKFDEAVTVSSNPALNLSIGNKVGYKITYSADRQTVYFTTTLSNTGNNADLRLKSISGLAVSDDAGNVCNYSNSSLSVGSLLYRSVFDVTSRLTNLQFSGASTVRYGSDYTAALTPESGYKLPENVSVKVNGASVSGYTYDKTRGQIKINSSAIKGDIEIAAAGVPQTYTVTFDMQGGSGGTESIYAAYTQTMPDVTPPSRPGYTFGGYYDRQNGTGARYYDIKGSAYGVYNRTENIVLYAKWTPKQYTVTLDAMGGTDGGTFTAEYDADMPAITKPTRKGYTFLGYFTQQNGGGEKYYNADGTSAKRYDKTDGLMLYAAWSAKSHTVTFDMQGGSGGTASTEATYDSKMPSVTPPERIGYAFGGYFENANGGGTQYYYADGEAVKPYDIDAACTLYAKWTANTYDVVLNAQGGSGGSTVTAVFGSNMPVIAAPDKPGYLFGGYFDGVNGGGTKYYNADCSSASVYNRAKGITLYALWTPITYNIQLYSRGENVGSLQNVVYGELRLPSDKDIGISYPNYNFVGWNVYDDQNWAMYTADRTYSAGLVTEQGKTAYVYAAWLEKDKYTVTYDANGGEGAPSAAEVHTGETISLSAAVPSRQNYTFAGWSEKSDSSAAMYQPNDSFTMGNSVVTLFAVWRKNPELVYNANGGVFGTYAGTSYPAAGSSVTLTDAVPQKEGCVFCGWAQTPTASRADIVSSPYTMPDHDTVLYAVYEPIIYTVSVFAADGYSVSGISAGGYTLGEYAGFTVSGTSPKVYINGVLAQPINGKYKFEIQKNTSVIVSDVSGVNVIYNANGGVNPPIDMRTYTNGDTAGIKSDLPLRNGYTFSGWAETADSGYAQYTGGEDIFVSAEDIVLYAVWEPIAYTVKYDANGGTGDMTAAAAVYDKELTLSPNTFTKTGCQFAGWAFSADGELAYADGANVKNLTDIPNGEVILYAVWNGAKTKINFHFEGGSSGTASCEAVYGKILPADKLIAPYRYGYTFAGYYTSANKGGDLVYNADMSLSDFYRTATWNSVADEFELYAAWEPVSYTVAFISGTQTLDTVSAVYGSIFSLPKAETLGVYAQEGYSFCGWSVAAGSDMVYYSDGQEITAGLTGENGAVVYLYAVIRKNDGFTVTLPCSQEGYKVYYNDAEITSPKDITVSKGDDVSFKVCVEDGYNSDKMTVLANGIMLGEVQTSGKNYTYNIKHISADTSVNIYHVKKETFRIILNDGTGYSISPKNTVVESGNDFSFDVTLSDGYKTSVPVVYVNGSTLNGIKNGDVFTYTVYGITSQPVISVSVAQKPQHTVTFVSNGSIYSIAAVEENMKVLQPSSPERNGYTFGGWYTDAACSNPYDFRTEVADDIRLYAKWTADTYAVEYDKNTADSVAVPSGQTKKHDSVLVLSPQIPVRTGYTFAAWNTKPDGTGTSYGAGSELSVNADITLYAQWRINKFAVSLITGDGVTGTLSANEAAYNETVRVTALSGDGYSSPVITAIPQENAELISEGVYRILGPVSFIAAAEAKRIYTANFYLDGRLYYTQSAIDGDGLTVALPNPPVKAGYSFIGWYTEQTGGVEVNDATALDKDLTVYARFEAALMHITPAVNGEGYTVYSADNTTLHYGNDYTFTVTVADHYNADNMKVYANGILLIPEANGSIYKFTVKNITDDVTITVYDVTADVYTVQYKVDGEVCYSEQVVYGDKAQKPKSPVKAGHTFAGWFDGDNEWDFADGVENDLELEAKFEALAYTIAVPEDNSEFTVNITSADSVRYGESFAFSITVSDGCNAADMTVYANGVLLEKTSENGNTVYFEIENVTESKVITVRGIGRNTYSVTYNENTTEYVGNMPKPKIKEYDADAAISDLTPERYGYTFAGWSTEKDGDVKYLAGDIYSENADITLYAVWEARKFAVNFETNGGVINAGEITEYTYGTGALLPTEVAKSGYTFAGWYEDELMQGARVYEIKASDFGDRKYYAAYTMANVNVSGYMGEYDGKAHDITYTLADNLVVEKYQWYFVPSGSNDAIPVSSAVYNTYPVKNAAESGEYYCSVEALLDGYVTRFFTEKATVEISKKPISVKAADSSKVYDAQPFSTNETELADGLPDGHKITAIMTAESQITNVGSCANEIERIVISDSENTDVTENYEITKQNGTLNVTPLTLAAVSKNVSISAGSALSENRLYEISGMLGNEQLSLKNAAVSVKNADNADVSFADVTKNTGEYTVTISYSGFDGEGSENYQGSGTLTSTVTVYRQSSGSGGGGGRTSAYTVSFNTNGGSAIESRSVKSGEKAKAPEPPEMEGYTFAGWYSDDTLTEKFDFAEKITKNITLYAKWTENKQNEEQPPENPTKTGVADLLETEKHISYLNGYSDDVFKPESNMTRAETAQMFYNLLLDKNVSGESTFDDVSEEVWYYDAVTALANMGIIKGIGENSFNPDGNITRAEFVAIAMRFANVDVNGSKTFTDVAQNHWAAKNISDAAYLGWISGSDDGTFSPDAFVKRASVAKIVNNMLGRKADIEYVHTHTGDVRLFNDVSDTAWYYADVIEAANTHEYEKNDGAETWK